MSLDRAAIRERHELKKQLLAELIPGTWPHDCELLLNALDAAERERDEWRDAAEKAGIGVDPDPFADAGLPSLSDEQLPGIARIITTGRYLALRSKEDRARAEQAEARAQALTAQRDRARDVAVAAEQEVARLREWVEFAADTATYPLAHLQLTRALADSEYTVAATAEPSGEV